MQDLPVQMHPRYQEFLKFMADCPHRKTPSTMETAFWAWLKIMSELCGHRWIETDKPFVFEKAGTDALKNDLDRLHRERDSFQEQSSYSQDLRDLAIFSSEQAVEIQILKNDLDRLHRERDSFQQQARCLAEHTDNDPILRDYSVWQAISDLERVCRHRTATAAEDWLQVEAENRTHIPTINYALEVLKAAGVEMDSKIGFPNIRIIYDRSNNKFFGKS